MADLKTAAADVATTAVRRAAAAGAARAAVGKFAAEGAADAAVGEAAVEEAASVNHSTTTAVHPVPVTQLLPAPIPDPPDVLGPRRSSREYRGSPDVRMAHMKRASKMKEGEADPKMYKLATKLLDATECVESCAAEAPAAAVAATPAEAAGPAGAAGGVAGAARGLQADPAVVAAADPAVSAAQPLQDAIPAPPQNPGAARSYRKTRAEVAALVAHTILRVVGRRTAKHVINFRREEGVYITSSAPVWFGGDVPAHSAAAGLGAT